MKKELDNISRWLEIFIYRSKRSKVQESGLADECRYWKESQNIDWLENIKEKGLRRVSSLIDVVKYYFPSYKEIVH